MVLVRDSDGLRSVLVGPGSGPIIPDPDIVIVEGVGRRRLEGQGVGRRLEEERLTCCIGREPLDSVQGNEVTYWSSC